MKSGIPLIFSIIATEFDGVKMISKVVFNKRELQTQGLTSDDFSGPTVSEGGDLLHFTT